MPTGKNEKDKSLQPTGSGTVSPTEEKDLPPVVIYVHEKDPRNQQNHQQDFETVNGSKTPRK